MIRIGIIGWRGLVGSILLNRIKTSFVLKYIELYLFSTNKIIINNFINSAFDLKLLSFMNIIISCQGSNYTKIVLKKILNKNWKGYWIDASSILRMNNECGLILDPLNKKYLLNNIKKKRIFSGANCTVSLCLLSLKNIINLNLIEKIFCNTYQALSGAGSNLILKIIKENLCIKKKINLLFLEKELNFFFKKKNPLLYNIIPWIDKKVNYGQTKEEWKSQSEASKILNKKIIIDSNCVRVSSLRCHSQSFIIKLNKKISIENFYEILNYKYVKLIKNDNINTVNELTPFNVSNKLKIFLGRIKKNIFNEKIFHLFSIGDQLLWGAAEPIKRFIEILIENIL